MTTIVAVGNSHMDAFRGALAIAPRSPNDPDFVSVSLCDPRCLPLWKHGDGEIEFSPGFIAAVRDTVAAHKGAPLVCFWSSKLYVMNTMVQPDRPFDFVMPDAPDYPADPDRELVPYDIVARYVRRNTRPSACMLRLIRRFHDGPLYVVSPPPPMRDLDRIMACLSTIMSESLRRRAERRGIPPIGVRMKFWRLTMRAVRDDAWATGGVFLDPPGASMDADGFLSLGLESDAAHGNAQYGAMLLDQIRARLSADGLI